MLKKNVIRKTKFSLKNKQHFALIGLTHVPMKLFQISSQKGNVCCNNKKRCPGKEMHIKKYFARSR